MELFIYIYIYLFIHFSRCTYMTTGHFPNRLKPTFLSSNVPFISPFVLFLDIYSILKYSILLLKTSLLS